MQVPLFRGRLRAILAIVTLAVLLAAPLQVFGAKGTGLAPTLTTLTEAVSLDQLMAFRVQFTNSGKSTITQFQFNGAVSGPNALPASFYWATPPCMEGSDPTAVTCNFGSLAAGASVDLVIVYRALVSGDVTFSGAFSGDAKNGTPGAKQDTWPTGTSQPVAVMPASAEFYGGWQFDADAQTFPTIGSQQLTTLSVPQQAAAYAVAYGHVDPVVACSTGAINGFGHAVDMTIAGGNSPVAVVIRFASQPGLNPSTLDIVHESDGECTFPPNVTGCATSGLPACFEPYWVGSGANMRVEVYVQLPHNGRLGGF